MQHTQLTDQQKQIIEAIRAAHQEAFRAGYKMEDGGTCNLDTCSLFLKDTGLTTKDVEALAPWLKPVMVFVPWRGEEENYVHLFGYEAGQAAQRTKMVETFVQTLRDKGYKAYVEYRID